MDGKQSCDYTYYGDTDSLDHTWTVPALIRELKERGAPKQVFDAGCGNGVVGDKLSKAGYLVTGVDLSSTGIANAQERYPHCSLHIGSIYDDLAKDYGQFPSVICLEVVEHLFEPKLWASRMFDLTQPGGMLFVSTPYHGYLKNLAICAAGKFDKHVDVMWDCGHIKFFSQATLSMLLEGAGFTGIRYRRLGRVPCFAKSMLAIARRPEHTLP
jgi:SAM-dependent methyltransferase